jgi:hypothetical protein
MMAMGLDHLVQWVDKGKVPPRAARILVKDGAIAPDQYGNAQGGVRNPYVDVPVALYGVPNSATGSRANVTINGQQAASFYCSIAGFETAMKPEDLSGKYHTLKNYQGEVKQSLKKSIKSGWFLSLYSRQVESDAKDVRFPALSVFFPGGTPAKDSKR